MLRTREAAEPTDLASIRQLEQRFGLRLPEPYRAFLLSTNGGRPERDLVAVPGCAASPIARVHFFFGIGDADESCDLAWNMEMVGKTSSGIIPFATTEGSDIFCLTPDGGVMFWDRYENKRYRLADDFERFLAQLHSDALSPVLSQ